MQRAARRLTALFLVGLGVARPELVSAQGKDAAPAHRVTMPEVIERFDAPYPAGPVVPRPISVVLFVSIDVHGHVTGIDIAESGGQRFDEAARSAVAHWRFSPAKRDDRAVAVRVRVPYRFEPPHEVPPNTTTDDASSNAVGHDTPPSQGETPTSARLGEREVTRPIGSANEPSTQLTALDGAAGRDPTPLAVANRTTEMAASTGNAAPQNATEASTVPGAPSVPSGTEVIVQGHYRAPTRGASDFHIDIGQLAQVPRKSAAEMLQLAPGILLTNEGGEGHAHQVFLRGFDAREGQDIEFTVGGVPINEAGNLHGNGHSDANFIIPETVLSLRVLEGPFDPRQGNFAVAGSADYRLGLERRGLTLKSTLGSYGTQRILGLWGPKGLSRCTFGAAEIYKTNGFGQNRDAQRASAMAQYEGKFGETGSYRVTGQAYSASFHSAGVIREDDYRAGRIGFYDTYDPRQGGDSSRYSLATDLEESVGDAIFREQLYLIRRDMRNRQNYTGYLLDVQEPTQNPHPQRGDGIDLAVDSWTLGSRGSSRVKETIGGLTQELEVGYAARGDFGHGTQLRVQTTTGIPYHRDIDVEYALGDIGLYADASLRFLSWLMLRGGVRGNFFAYDVLNRCAQTSVRQPSRSDPPGDQSCLDQQNFGQYRDPTQRSSTATTTLLPRASILLTPATGFMLSMSYGQGVRSMDPIYISQDLKTPFARVDAVETGAVYSRTLATTQLVTRATAFRTHVAEDLIFSETEGRNTLANGTTRLGILGAVRFTGAFFDQSLNGTVVRSRFDDTGLTVPYVPNLVVRSDTALHHELPIRWANHAVSAAGGVGVTYVGRRPLPYDQLSDPMLTLDASASFEWHRVELGFEVTNLFDRRYRLGEYNYASDFRMLETQPTLVPMRHFSAGPPRMFFVTLAVNFGGAS